MFNEFEIKKGVVLRNKFVVSPMTTWASNEDFTVSEDELCYYAARAEDAGMVITASAHVQPDGQAFENQIYAGDDTYIPSLRQLSKSIKKQGAKAVLQLQHGGRQAIVEHEQLVSASAVKALYNPSRPGEAPLTPRALTNDEIADIIEAFYQATCRAIAAGFDGIEIHGANTYLIQQFFSPHSNRRDDQWGGTIEKRMNFPLKIVEAVNRAKREHANDGFITGYRFSPEEREKPGISIEDTLQLIDRLAETDIDYLHVSQLNFMGTSINDETDTRIIGKLVSDKINGRKPLIGVGSITDLQKANEALNTVGYDLIALGRSVLYDPHWIRKKISGKRVFEGIHLNKLYEQTIPPKMANVVKDLPGVNITG